MKLLAIYTNLSISIMDSIWLCDELTTQDHRVDQGYSEQSKMLQQCYKFITAFLLNRCLTN